MIQTYTWKVAPLGQHLTLAGDKFLKAANGIMAYTSFLKGADVTLGENELLVSLRVSGKDRWAAQAHAKQVGEKVLKAAGLWMYEIEHVSTVTEPNRRGLKDGEGRTPRPRPPKSA